MSVESALRNPRSRCSILLLAFGIACGTGIAVLGIFLLSMAPGNWREMQEAWTECPGTITAVRVKATQIRTGNQPEHYHHSTSHSVALDCLYTVNGTEYTATALPAPKQPRNTNDAAEAESIADAYRAGEPITVYHHPTDPQRSRLDHSAPNGLFWMSVLFGPISILAGLGLAWWTFIEWRSKTHPT